LISDSALDYLGPGPRIRETFPARSEKMSLNNSQRVTSISLTTSEQEKNERTMRVQLFIPVLPGDSAVLDPITSALSEADVHGGYWTYPSKGSLTDREGELVAAEGVVVEIQVETSQHRVEF